MCHHLLLFWLCQGGQKRSIIETFHGFCLDSETIKTYYGHHAAETLNCSVVIDYCCYLSKSRNRRRPAAILTYF